jgi:serine/threonine protein phosphatase PrpC
MEDAHIVQKVEQSGRPVILVGVFDGHGGKAVARFAAKYLGDAFRETFEANPQGVDFTELVSKALAGSFERVDEMLNASEGREEVRVLEVQEAPPKKSQTMDENASGLKPRKSMNLDSAAASAVAEAQEEEGEEGANAGQRLLQQIMDQHASPEGMGATSVVCAVIPPEGYDEFDSGGKPNMAGWTVTCANAGDSRAVLCRGGTAIALSEDHKPDDPIENKRIYAAGGHVRNGRVCDNLNLSRALGDFNYKDWSKPAAERVITCVPDMKTFKLEAEDEFLLLGCDGIWERNDRQAVVDYFRSRMANDGESEGLVGIACDYLDFAMCKDLNAPDFDGSGCDNMTIVCVNFR